MATAATNEGGTTDVEDLALYAAEDGVAVVTFNRPDRMNAWTPEFGDRYFDLLERAARDPDVRAIVVTGAGRAFCAGADVGLLANVSDEPGGGAPRGRHEPVDTLLIPKPVICAINGAAIGLGLVFALMADVRFAAAGAKLGTGFSRLGLVAEHGTAWILQRLVGQPAAMELLLSGRTFLAEEALTLGLVSQVHPKDELLGAATAYARDLAEHCSPLSMALIKRQVLLDADRSFHTALAESRRLTDRSLGFPDFKEGLASFAERRPPRFAGLAAGGDADPLA
jgi:enoyl-CoA hydratase/carnithine racemase